MSIRAYRLNNIDFNEESSFNFSFDGDLIDVIEKEFNMFEKLNMDGSGITEIPVLVLQRAIRKKGISNDVKISLRKDIKWAKDNKKGYILYYCF